MYTVYIKINDRRRIVDVASSAFLTDADDWIPIARGNGDRYMHAGGYFPGGLMDERGVYRYAFTNNAVVELTQAELDADYARMESVPQGKSDRERIEELEAQGEMLTQCLLEVSEIIYA